ncbi:hypothetical protein HJG60_011842 [Phyllostomus discolor]|uniref:Uncharacterized protein n=1 Tax=Phyllostomus discolor TaxID=89673 RepID=A0A834DWE5_9CHIR|nr:hypothetical protein HJG60_011842 [Phyllostomus discolor]
MRPERLGQVPWWSAGVTPSSTIQATPDSGLNSVQKGEQTQAPSGQTETQIYLPGLGVWGALLPKASWSLFMASRDSDHLLQGCLVRMGEGREETGPTKKAKESLTPSLTPTLQASSVTSPPQSGLLSAISRCPSAKMLRTRH